MIAFLRICWALRRYAGPLGPQAWEPDDAAALRLFLCGTHGRRLCAYLSAYVANQAMNATMPGPRVEWEAGFATGLRYVVTLFQQLSAAGPSTGNPSPVGAHPDQPTAEEDLSQDSDPFRARFEP